jgi:signal transduction histidine kinase
VASTDIDPAAVRPAPAANLSDEALEEINRLWTIVRAFSNAAHDVNNDLQVIGGSAELLERRELDPAVRRRVEAIREQAVAAAATINRLLAYSRAEPAAPGPIDVSQVVTAAVAMRRSSLSRARIGIAIGSMPQPCWAMADGRRTLQALLDTLLAAEGIARGRPNARILLQVEHDDDTVAIQVVTDAAGASQDAPAAASPSSTVTVGGQLWAAAHLARSQQGSLRTTAADGAQSLTLRVPVYPTRS